MRKTERQRQRESERASICFHVHKLCFTFLNSSTNDSNIWFLFILSVLLPLSLFLSYFRIWNNSKKWEILNIELLMPLSFTAASLLSFLFSKFYFFLDFFWLFFVFSLVFGCILLLLLLFIISLAHFVANPIWSG